MFAFIPYSHHHSSSTDIDNFNLYSESVWDVVLDLVWAKLQVVAIRVKRHVQATVNLLLVSKVDKRPCSSVFPSEVSTTCKSLVYHFNIMGS